MRENEGVAARILLDFDCNAEKVRNEIIRMLSGPGRARRSPPPPPRWEYHLEPWPPGEWVDRLQLLNELGAEGWTLVGIAGDEFVFQRAARPKHPPPPEETAAG